jgi:hypothetical protein
MKYEFHPHELTIKINLKCRKNNDYQKLSHHPYRNLEYELLKIEIPFYKQPKIKESSKLLDQDSYMQLHHLPF